MALKSNLAGAAASLLLATWALAQPRELPPRAAQKNAQSIVQSKPFAQLLAVERAALANADVRRLGGRDATVNEYLIVYVRFTDVSRWLPRDAATEPLFVGTAPATLVGLPLGAAVPLLVPFTGVDSRRFFALWSGPRDMDPTASSDGELLVSAKAASARKDRYVLIPPALVEQALRQNAKPIVDVRGLQLYALDRARELARREKPRAAPPPGAHRARFAETPASTAPADDRRRGGRGGL